MNRQHFALSLTLLLGPVATHAVAAQDIQPVQAIAVTPAAANTAAPATPSSIRIPLLDAVRAGDGETVTRLLPLADDTEVADALHLAVGRRKADMARILLTRGIDINRKLHGRYPLDTAVEYEDVDMVRVLMEHGADIDVPGRHDVSPMAQARRKGNQAVIDAMTATRGNRR